MISWVIFPDPTPVFLFPQNPPCHGLPLGQWFPEIGEADKSPEIDLNHIFQAAVFVTGHLGNC